MKFKRFAKVTPGVHAFDFVSLVNVVFLLLLFYILTTAFTLFPDIDVRMPKALTSDALREENFVVSITSENVIYWRNKIVSIKDLQLYLSQLSKNNPPILIKVDRRASVGRIVDVWDLCRSIGIERISIATNREQ